MNVPSFNLTYLLSLRPPSSLEVKQTHVEVLETPLVPPTQIRAKSSSPVTAYSPTCETFPAPVNVKIIGPILSGNNPYWISLPKLVMAALAALTVG